VALIIELPQALKVLSGYEWGRSNRGQVPCRFAFLPVELCGAHYLTIEQLAALKYLPCLLWRVEVLYVSFACHCRLNLAVLSLGALECTIMHCPLLIAVHAFTLDTGKLTEEGNLAASGPVDGATVHCAPCLPRMQCSTLHNPLVSLFLHLVYRDWRMDALSLAEGGSFMTEFQTLYIIAVG
jgi:hypothetical protein